MRHSMNLMKTAMLMVLFLGALPAFAQGACPGACITYTSVASVPLTPELTFLIALVLGGAGYFFLRRNNHRFLAVALASTIGISAVMMNARESIATSPYEVVLASGNYATVTFPSTFQGTVAVRNPQSSTVIISNITVASGFTINPSSVLTVGAHIPPGAVIDPALDITPPEVCPPGYVWVGGACVIDD